MLLDAIAPNSYITINKNLIKAFGLDVATYISIILTIDKVAVSKRQTYNEEYFMLNRELIQDQTSLNEKQQDYCDNVLAAAGVIYIDLNNKDLIKIDLNKLLSIMIAEDFDPKSLPVVPKRAVKKSANDRLLDRIKKELITESEAVRAAYLSWANALIEVKGRISLETVTFFKKELEAYTSQEQVKIDILNQAAALGYKEFSWVKKVYEDKRGSRPQRVFGTTIDNFNNIPIANSTVSINRDSKF